MARDWSRLEVEATVASYLGMLVAELRGEAVNKSEARRGLLRLLDGRSPGAVERKHQNISAILLSMELPYVEGYKPLSNYQQLLRTVVEDRLTDTQDLLAAVEKRAHESVVTPSVEDILAILEDPPERSDRPSRFSDSPPRSPARRNYLELEARNASVGAAGEQLVLRFERARLLREDKGGLADRVEQVSLTVGDAEGYDIRSFETNGKDRLIEVKSTTYGKYTPFFVTQNELRVSERRAADYHLYRVFRLGHAPRLFSVTGNLGETCLLEAVQYRSRVA